MTSLVIFDCDGVLADSEVISAEVLIAALERLGTTITREYVLRNFIGRSFPKVAASLREEFGIALPDDFESTYRATLLKAFETRLDPTPGLHDMLKDLGVRACVATSSSPPRVARTLAIIGLTDFFGDAVFTASMVANGKPAPDLFELAAATLGVAPQECLVIEDSLVGVAAAQAARMPVWRYTGGGHLAGTPRAALATPQGVASFDNWGDFFLMAPDLVRQD